MRDLIVLVPGITGSVLKKDDKDVWAISGASLSGFLKSAGHALQALRLPIDYDPRKPPNDGVRATGVFPDFHGVFGLGKIDGYTGLDSMIRETFDLIAGTDDPDVPANYFKFPYDWRLSNRLTGEYLKEFVTQRLHTWRKHTSPDAKAILLAHSMGGLVARHYLECLEGWKDCRALVTFGTPFRGSVAAVDYLANGYKQLFVDLTAVMRSMPSVYELLPIYPVLKIEGKYARVHEADGLPHIDRARAAAGRRFHDDIESAVNRHRNDVTYLRDRYVIIPMVGTRQPTLQSAVFDGHAITVSGDIYPDVVDHALRGGDGTVPRVSATPIELSKEHRETFFVERHGSLQNNPNVLDDLADRLRQLQSEGLENIRGTWESRSLRARPTISLHVDDAYVRGEEPVRVDAALDGADAATVLRARIQRIDAQAPIEVVSMVEAAGVWSAYGDHLPEGTYRITVESDLLGDVGPTPVTDVFEILGPRQTAGGKD